jgi:hypothetical protein
VPAATSKFLHLAIRDNPRCVSGSLQLGIDQHPISLLEVERDTDEDALTFELASDSPLLTLVRERRVASVHYAGNPATDFDEWRIIQPARQRKGPGRRWEVVCAPMVWDLALPGVLVDPTLFGEQRQVIRFAGATVEEAYDEFVAPFLIDKGYTWIGKGLIVPTTPLTDARASFATPLEFLRFCAGAVSTPEITYIVRLRRNGVTNYLVDIVERGTDAAGDPLPIADVRYGKNLIDARIESDGREVATDLEAKGTEIPITGGFYTIARTGFKITAKSTDVLTVADPDPDGGPMIREDDQLVGRYLQPTSAAVPPKLITDSDATAQTLTMASGAGASFAVNDIVELRADTSGTLVTSLSSPAARARYAGSIITRVVERSDLTGERNLHPNAFLRDYANSSSVADGFTLTRIDAGGANGTIVRDSDPTYAMFGPYTMRMRNNFKGLGIQGIPFGVAGAPGADRMSVMVRVAFRSWQKPSWMRVTLLQTVPLVLGLPVVLATILLQTPDNAFGGVSVIQGSFKDIILQDIPIPTSPITCRVDVEAVTPSDELTLGAWYDLHVGPYMVVQYARGPESYSEFGNANKLYAAVQKAFEAVVLPIDTYRVGAVDFTRLDGTAYPYDALVRHAQLRVTDAGLLVPNGELLRIAGLERDKLVETSTTLVLASRRKTLTETLRDSVGGAGTITITSATGSAATPPPTSTPPPTTTPPPGSGTPGGGTPVTPGPLPDPGGVVTGAPGNFSLTIVGGPALVIDPVPAVATRPPEWDVSPKAHNFKNVKSIRVQVPVLSAGPADSRVAVRALLFDGGAWRYFNTIESAPWAPIDAVIEADGVILPSTGAWFTLDPALQVENVILEPVTVGGDDASPATLGNVYVDCSSILMPPSGELATPEIPTDGLIAYWELTEGSGSSVASKDPAPSGPSLTLGFTTGTESDPRFDPSWQTGPRRLRPAGFDLVYSAFSHLANIPSYAAGSACFMYVDVTTFGGLAKFFMGTGNSPYVYRMGVDGSNKLFAQITEDSGGTPTRTATGTTTISNGSKHLVGFIHDGTNLKVYVDPVDGLPEGTVACAAALFDATTDLIIGGGAYPPGAGQPDNFDHGDVVYASGAAVANLTPDKIAELYAKMKLTYTALP